MDTGLDMVHEFGDVGHAPLSHDSNPICRPFSPLVNFDSFFTNPVHCFGSPNLGQTHAIGGNDDLLWGLSSASSILNGPLDFTTFLLETSVDSPVRENAALGNDHQQLILGGPVTISRTRSHLEDARSIIKSLVQHGKMTQCHKISASAETDMPDVEDIMESLESLLPEAEAPSREISGISLSLRNTSSSSSLFTTLLYSFTNNLAGLRDVPRNALMELLRENHDIRTQLFEFIKSGQTGVARPLAESLFRAAVEGCNADAVATIIHHTKSNAKIAIDPNEIVCNFEDKDYTPIELAAKFRNKELVRMLVASRADPNKTYRWERDKYWEKGALALTLGHWVNGSEHPFIPSPAGEPEPVNLDLLRMLLDCGAEVRMNLLVNAMRPGPGNSEIAEELVSRMPASNHQLCFKNQWILVSMAHYLENSTANRLIRRIFADCFESTDCGNCTSENPKLIERILSHAARRSNLELSRFLVQHTTQLQSALAAAVRAASEELVQLFMDRGAHVDDPVEPWQPRVPRHRDECVYDENGYDRPRNPISGIEYIVTPIRTPLAEAIRTGNDRLINTFERLGALACIGDEHHFQAAVLAAAEVGNISYLKVLLHCGSGLPTGMDLTFPLAVAIRNEETSAALILLDAGANVLNGLRNRTYGEPLVSALERRNKRVVESMLECNFYHPGYPYAYNKAALEVAASWCGVDLIKDLMQLGSNINEGINTTALGTAVRYRNKSFVHQLLDLGAKAQPESLDSDLVPPLRAALHVGHHDMARFLITKGADSADHSAFEYAMDHDTAGYELLLAAFRSQYPHGLPGFGGSLLAKAIELGSQVLLDSLLDAGADVNSWCTKHSRAEPQPMRNHRVLGIAIMHHKGQCNELVRKLLNKGAKPNLIVGEYEVTSEHWRIPILEPPLVLAIKTKNLTMVSLLLEHGADLNMPPRRGIKRTPLQAACETGSYKMVEFLLQRGGSVNSAAAERHGGTALQMAAKTGSLKIVKLLLDNHADPHMAKSKVGGRTAFEAAAENGCLDILRLLWDAVSPFGFSDKECQSAKGFAKQKGHRGCVDFIDFLSSGSSQSFLA